MKNLIKLLSQNQKDDGSFFNSDKDTNLLYSSILLIELTKIKATRKTNLIKEKLNNWLFNQKDENWIFSDQLLINFLVLSALSKNNPTQLSGEAIGKTLKQLIRLESKPGGPYYLALNKKEIDPATNIIIAYFLSLQKVDLPNLNNLTNETIINNNINDGLIFYILSLFYRGQKKLIIRQQIIKFNNKKDRLSNLLCLAALSNLGATTIKPIIKIYCPLEKILHLNLSASSVALKDLENNQDKKVLEKILLRANDRFKYLNKDFKDIALSEIKKVISNNKDGQMSLITSYLKRALGKNGRKINNDLIIEAGLANIFFWTAFIIYDDFWDEDEKAKPSILPCANLYARAYTSFYHTVLPGNNEFQTFFNNLMDKLDAANTWETLHCRTEVCDSKFIIPKELPDYQDYTLKFEPTSGQILGPIVLMLKLGFKLESSEISNLTNYFKNYLIAMQINDDAHDLIEDLSRGHLSTAVVIFIEDWQREYPEKTEIDLDLDLDKIKKLFWFKTLPKTCNLTIKHTSLSRLFLEKLYFIENQQALKKLINTTENVARLALRERQKSIELLHEF
jgi:hypothetical protein